MASRNGVHIVVGLKTMNATEEEHLIHYGCDGVKALEAAQRACDSGEYVSGRIKYQVIQQWRLCNSVPVPGPTSAAKAKAPKQTASA